MNAFAVAHLGCPASASPRRDAPTPSSPPATGRSRAWRPSEDIAAYRQRQSVELRRILRTCRRRLIARNRRGTSGRPRSRVECPLSNLRLSIVILAAAASSFRSGIGMAKALDDVYAVIGERPGVSVGEIDQSSGVARSLIHNITRAGCTGWRTRRAGPGGSIAASHAGRQQQSKWGKQLRRVRRRKCDHRLRSPFTT